MIKFNGTSFLNNVIIGNGGTIVPPPPNVTTEWPASQPLLFDQPQTSDNLWGAVNFVAPVTLLTENGGQAYLEFAINPISSPGETMPESRIYAWEGNPFTFTNQSSDPDYYDGLIKYNGSTVGSEGTWGGPTGGYVAFEGQPSYPSETPSTAHGFRKKIGDITDVYLWLKNDKPSYAAMYFTPDENMPQGKTFIDNWGPLGLLNIEISTKRASSGLFGQMDGTQPVNALAGIVRRSAVSTPPSLIAFVDIVSGVLIRNNVAIFIQNGVELYRTTATANPGPANSPGGFVDCTATPAFWYEDPNGIEWYGYDGISEAITLGDAPNGLEDFTNTVRINTSQAFIPKKNGTHDYPITQGGSTTTMTMTYNASTNFVSSATVPSGTTAPSQNYEGSGLAFVCHNETNLVGMADAGEPLNLEIRIVYSPDYDREGLQARSFTL